MKRSVGWLWYDDSAVSSLEEKVRRAAERYRRKFGRAVQLCFVKGAEGTMIVDEITVLGVTDLPRHHFWLEGERE